MFSKTITPNILNLHKRQWFVFLLCLQFKQSFSPTFAWASSMLIVKTQLYSGQVVYDLYNLVQET